MNRLLFINACPRPQDQSRTYALCRDFLDAYRALHPADTLEILNLSQEPLQALDAGSVARRDALIAAGDWDHSMLRYARQFAAADKILVGAPYWDLAFPAQLKVYVENICVCGVTFGYTESGQAGLCAARKLLYVTTAGGPVGDNLGAQYLRALCNMLGIPEFLSVEAENLDVIGVDWQASLRAAANELQALAANF